ncbi:MAG: glycogen debranching enzyme, partial [Solirubrobacteraceae bacterium]
MRDFWRGNTSVADFARRLAGSSDLYGEDGRLPAASINFITAHDGFTLADLVSYNDKHNDDNLEDNEDGTDDNRSWNCGVEGPTDDSEILALRGRQQRNMLVTLLLSQGVPMLLGGDEFSRGQGGNNNAWCQDNEISWFDWELDEHQLELLAFTKRVIALRQRHPVFRRRHFLLGEATDDGALPDAWWFRLDGRRMTGRDWARTDRNVLGLFLNGHEFPYRGHRGEKIVDDSFLLLINGHHEDVTFTLPAKRWGQRWAIELSTAEPAVEPASATHGARSSLEALARSVTVLKRVDPAG